MIAGVLVAITSVFATVPATQFLAQTEFVWPEKIAIVADVLGVSDTHAIKYMSWVWVYEENDKVAIDEWISNTGQNFWWGFSFVLPYLGAFVGIMLVVWVVIWLAYLGMKAFKRRRG